MGKTLGKTSGNFLAWPNPGTCNQRGTGDFGLGQVEVIVVQRVQATQDWVQTVPLLMSG